MSAIAEQSSSYPEGILVAEPVVGATLDYAESVAHPMAAPEPGPVTIPVTPGRLLRALRRRWLLALLAAAAASIAAGLLADRFISSTYTVRTEVYIPANRSPVASGSGEPSADSANAQRRQSAFVRSRHVLHVALQRPGISELEMIRNSSDPATMLEKDLVVDFGSSPDIMRVSLKGSSPEEMIRLLNAIREAYLDEGVNREIKEKNTSLKWLRDLIADEEGKLAVASREVSERAGKLNAPDLAAVRLRYQNNVTELANLRTQRFQLDSQKKAFVKLQSDLQAIPISDESPTGFASLAELKAAFELAQASDEALNAVNLRISTLKRDILEYERVMAVGTTNKNLDTKRSELKNATMERDQRLKVLEKEVSDRLVAESKGSTSSRRQEHQSRLAKLTSEIAATSAQIESLDADITRIDRDALEQARGIADMDQLASRANGIDERVKASKLRAEGLETELAIASPFQARTQEEAVVTQLPNVTKKRFMMIGAVAVAFLAALFGVAYLDLRGGRLYGPQDADRVLRTGLVGCIPNLTQPALESLTRSSTGLPGAEQIELCDAADACRALLLNSLSGSQSKVIMISSAIAGEGKTSLTAQLALSLGRAGYRTLVIDADVRQPMLHSLFGRSLSPGLTDVLRTTYPLERVIRKSPLSNLVVIPAGHCHPHEAVSLLQVRLGSLLQKHRSHFDVILIDTPPLLDLPDAMVIGRHTDGIILSLMNEVSTLPKAQLACARLQSLNIPLIGAVLNGVKLRRAYEYR